MPGQEWRSKRSLGGGHASRTKKSIGLPDTAYLGAKLAEDPRYGRSCGTSQLAKSLAVYDRSDPGAARAIIVAGLDFEGTSPKLFWPETLV